MIGVRGELTGQCVSIREQTFTMSVDGEKFKADVLYEARDAATIAVGDVVFVVGRINLRNFDTGKVFVHAERVEVLNPPDDEPVVEEPPATESGDEAVVEEPALAETGDETRGE
jgi:hypothetical protein